MTEQMSREEMLQRLSNGEDPIDISIDKWIRMRAWIEEMYIDLRDRCMIYRECHFLGDTCALCVSHKCSYNIILCDECILGDVDCRCNDDDSAWMKFNDAIIDHDNENENWLQNVLNAADNMIAALNKCKRG